MSTTTCGHLRDHREVRQVLVALFWFWFAVAVLVYGYRLYRRVTQGPKAQREAKAAAAEGRAAGMGHRVGRRSALPPLPEGPVEARLPSSLVGKPPPGPEGEAAATSPVEGGAGAEIATTSPAASAPPPDAGPPPRPTVVAALAGISLPCELVPVVDVADDAVADGYRVVFSTRSSTVRGVTAGLADELERLGYEVTDTAVGDDGDARRLRARRAGLGVDVEVRAGDDPSSVVADVTT
jgi:hypothetical protein